MEVAACAWYNKALRKINHSIRDRELVKADQTLLVVLLLGLYEVGDTLCDFQEPKAYLPSDKHLYHAPVDEILVEPHQRSNRAVRAPWRRAA
jgi:hypothetical protein